MWNLAGILYGIYLFWLVKKILINKDREALREFVGGLTGIAVWAIVFAFHDIVKNMNLHVHSWHMKPLISYFYKGG